MTTKISLDRRQIHIITDAISKLRPGDDNDYSTSEMLMLEATLEDALAQMADADRVKHIADAEWAREKSQS